MGTMQTEEAIGERLRPSLSKAEFDALLAESRLYLERARVHMARAEILRLREELERERARRRRGLFGSHF
jgi:hypothetical protein